MMNYNHYFQKLRWILKNYLNGWYGVSERVSLWQQYQLYFAWDEMIIEIVFMELKRIYHRFCWPCYFAWICTNPNATRLRTPGMATNPIIILLVSNYMNTIGLLLDLIQRWPTYRRFYCQDVFLPSHSPTN